MNLDKLTSIRPFLLIAAIVGFLAINCPFLYFALFDEDTYNAAMRNGVALVFVAEAFLLMFFFAWVIARMGWKRPGWVFFIVMSLLGSMAFSVPFQLWLLTRPKRGEKENAG